MLNFISYFYFWKPVMLRQKNLLGQKNQASVEHILSYTKVLVFFIILPNRHLNATALRILRNST